MRFGDVSFVSPFRYTLIIWAMLIGYFFFKEKIDLLSLIGIFLIIFSGLFGIIIRFLGLIKSF